MKSTVRFLIFTIFFTTMSSFASVYGAAPSGDRGGKLSAAEKAQQKLLRQLRRDIAIHRILSRETSSPVIAKAPALAQLPISTSVIKPVQSASRKSFNNSSNCSNTVDNCFLKLESLFQDHFGEEFQISQSIASKDQPITEAGI